MLLEQPEEQWPLQRKASTPQPAGTGDARLVLNASGPLSWLEHSVTQPRQRWPWNAEASTGGTRWGGWRPGAQTARRRAPRALARSPLFRAPGPATHPSPGRGLNVHYPTLFFFINFGLCLLDDEQTQSSQMIYGVNANTTVCNFKNRSPVS